VNLTRNRSLLLAAFFGLAVFLLALNLVYAWRIMHKPAAATEASAQPAPLPAFTLTDQDGKPFGSANLQGKVWVASFVFTTCRGPCPIITQKMSQVQSLLAGTPVQMVSISVDPENDTPPVFKAYARKFGADETRWHFLTGTRAQVYEVVRNGFFLVIQENGNPQKAPDEGAVIHSTRLAVVDDRGVVREYIDGTAADAPAQVQAVVRKLLP